MGIFRNKQFPAYRETVKCVPVICVGEIYYSGHNEFVDISICRLKGACGYGWLEQ